MECTGSFTTLLSEFRCVFTQPSFRIFVCLMTAWVLTHRRRFVTELIGASGCTHQGHHSGNYCFGKTPMQTWAAPVSCTRCYESTGWETGKGLNSGVRLCG
jgi:hypothetical protein